ncbi:YxeA family protein [Schleiferilactobacillus harbinensis]|nr:YxeA family protein [Schleiferilactobacillus harbinensis]
MIEGKKGAVSMRKVLIGIGVFVLLVAGVGFGLKFWTRDQISTTAQVIDLLNPFVTQETVYVQTTSRYAQRYKDSTGNSMDYAYDTVSYNAQGQARTIRYTAFGKKIKPNHYLAITTKGQNVRQWAEVAWRNIPSAAQVKLK